MTDFISNNLIINVIPDGKCHIDIVKSAEIQLQNYSSLFYVTGD